MTARRNTDRLIETWLTEVAPEHRVEYLGETLMAIDAIGQRPVWASPSRWLPGRLTGHPVALPRLAPTLVILALLLVATIVAVALAGSRPHLPAPYGLAAPGLVAFESGGDIVATRPDGTGRRTLIDDPGAQWGQIWSHRGDRLAYWSAPQIGDPASLWVADADGRNRRLITDGQTFVVADYLPGVDWSPDDRRLAFSTDAEHGGIMYVVNADGTHLARIGDDTHQRLGPVWSPDGTLIAYTGQPVRGSNDYMSNWVITPDGITDTLIIPGVGTSTQYGDFTNINPSWSPDGRSFLVHSGQGPNTDIVIAELGADGSWSYRTIIGLPAEELRPAWSTSGTQFAFIRMVGGADALVSTLIVANADGTNVHPIRPISHSLLCWSPDDRFIRVGGPIENGPFRTIFLIAVDGSSTVEISAPGSAGYGVCPIQRIAP